MRLQWLHKLNFKMETQLVATAETTTAIGQTYDKLSAQVVEDIIKNAKNMGTKEVGLPSSDSIDYLSVDVILEPKQSMYLSKIAHGVEMKTNEETGEVTPSAFVVLVDADGKLWKCASHMVLSHFLNKNAGYQCQMTYMGLVKTSTGNKMFKLEFRPLYDVAI